MRTAALFFCFALTGCTGTSHIPPPWELPGAAIGSVIENATYGAKRKRVKAFLRENRAQVFADMRAGDGPALQHTYALANISEEARAKLHAEILANPEIYLDGPAEQTLENLTVSFMVHGN